MCGFRTDPHARTVSASSTPRGRVFDRHLGGRGAPSVGKFLLLAYLPPEHAVGRYRPARALHERGLPGAGRGGGVPTVVRSPTTPRMKGPEQSIERLAHSRLREGGSPAPGAQITLTSRHPGRRRRRNLAFTTSPHEEWRGSKRPSSSSRRTAAISTVLTVGPPRSRGAAAVLRLGRRAATRSSSPTTSWLRAGISTRRLRPARSPRGRPHARKRRPLARSTCSCSATSRPTPAASRSAWRVARMLGLPIVNGIKGIAVADGVLTARARGATPASRCIGCRFRARGRREGGHQPPAVPPHCRAGCARRRPKCARGRS